MLRETATHHQQHRQKAPLTASMTRLGTAKHIPVAIAMAAEWIKMGIYRYESFAFLRFFHYLCM
jgi:hypothetical protein